MDTPSAPPPSPQKLPVPIEKQGRKYYERNKLNAHIGRLLWFRVRVQGMSTHDAWMDLHPDTKAARRSVQVMASRFLKWYDENYPATFHEIAQAYNLNPDRMGEILDECFNAKIWRWDPKQEQYVETNEPNLKMRLAAWDRLLKLMEKDEKWRKQFLEQEQDRPMQFNIPPEHATVEQWEEWAKSQDLIGSIERRRKEATEARNRRLQEEGRPLPPPPVNGAHTPERR